MSETLRIRIRIRGAVQGVGFRPNVYRIATEMGLFGWVNNTVQGVLIEVEGSKKVLETFYRRVLDEKPPLAVIQGSESTWLDPVGFTSFEVQESEEEGDKTALVLPDVATCSDCLEEIFDPEDRRFGYPFTNCTNCGPRFTIIETLPYDRQRTTMRHFPMCEHCQAEYGDPANRRFHAQPNACPTCGPQLEFWDEAGKTLAKRHEALLMAAEVLRDGKILALKGLGGFHLMVDARSDEAIARLRARKHREEKPLAVMFANLDSLKKSASLDEAETRMLCSPECPIVLLARSEASEVSEQVAPGNPTIGAFLPYTPLHHLLLREVSFPLVATSGNLTDEPIVTDEREVVTRLKDIADAYLVHDRPIVRYVDDSIVRFIGGRATMMRRARGYAPLPVKQISSQASVLALGGHFKNTIAFSSHGNVFMSHHLGDLENLNAIEAFKSTAKNLPALYDQQPEKVVSDLHPDYFSSQYAKQTELPLKRVQHHYAHVLSCMVDNELDAPVLGVAWDGTGLGLNRTIWGGEFLTVSEGGWKRVAHLRTFPLPGGDAVARKPNRVAMGLLYEAFGDQAFSEGFYPSSSISPQDFLLLSSMLSKELRCVRTSSMGRLFDAFASILNLRHECSYEGQAAMELEFAALRGGENGGSYHLELRESKLMEGSLILDWFPMLETILADTMKGTPLEVMAKGFHDALVEGIVKVASHVGLNKVLLTGGCFQNKYLTEKAILRLKEAGFTPYWHQRIPPNDGGLSVGQLMAGIEDQ